MSAAPNDASVQHRFVHIHQAVALVPNEIAKLWNVLERPEVPAIAASNACDKLINAIQDDRALFQDIMRHLQNLAFISQCRLRISVLLHAITRLLTLHMTARQLHDVPLALSSSSKEMIHPFVFLLQQRPQLYPMLLTEIDTMLEDMEPSTFKSFLGTMDSFFDAVFLLDFDTVDSNALLTRLGLWMTRQDIPVELIFYRLLTISQRCPSQYAFDRYLSVVDVLMGAISPTGSARSILSENLPFVVTDLQYQLLSKAYDAATYGYPMIPFVRRLHQLLALRESLAQTPTTVNNYVLWSSLSYFLFSAQTVDDQLIVLRMMRTIIMHIDGSFLLIALLPLFQTLSELSDAKSEFKALVLDLLSLISKGSSSLQQSSSDRILDDVNEELANYPMAGVFGHSISHFFDFFQQTLLAAPQPVELHPTMTTVSQLHVLLYSTPFVFHADASVRNSYLSHLVRTASLISAPSRKFPLLMLLMYLMRQPVSSIDTLLHILHQSIPDLVDVNDPITTSKALQVTLSIVQGAHAMKGLQTVRETTLASIGVKVLTKIYMRQPRVWQELKKLLSDWVLRRKSSKGKTWNKLGGIQMEIAMLTIMRDLCRLRPTECAQDILPMVVSILQTCEDLSIASLSLLMETMCACIEAGMAETRSMWTVAIMYIAQYAMDMDNAVSSLLIQKLCDFFALVGDKDEVSEPYMDFKDAVLNHYIVHLIRHQDTKIKECALHALSHFPAPDIATLLPEKTKQFMQEILDSDKNSAYSAVLTKLMSHELDHMRRGLFKEEVSHKATEKEETQVPSGRSSIGQSETHISNQFLMAWQNSRIIPGLRTGYALGTLHVAGTAMDDAAGANTKEVLLKTKWYRLMVSSLADIGLTDHLLIRVSSLGSWMAFFGPCLLGNQTDLEVKGDLLMKDLLSRLNSSTVPGMTSNILLAIAGLVLTLNRTVPSFAAAAAKQMVDILKTKYLKPSGSNATQLMSDEVQFAARFCLGHVAVCIIANEKIATEVLSTLLENATEPAPQRNIDTAVDLIQFADGYAAGHYSAALATWPTKTDDIANLAENATQVLMGYLDDTEHASESKVLGIWLGWASNMKTNDMKTVYERACKILKAYGDGSRIHKPMILGACWVAAYGVVNEDGKIDEETAGCLDHIMSVVSSDASMAQHQHHFNVPCARLARLRLGTDDLESEGNEYYSGLLLSELQSVQYDAPSDPHRTAALFSIGSLLGVDYLATTYDAERLAVEGHKYDAKTRKPVLLELTTMAGLTYSEEIGHLKSGRIAAIICGKIVQVTTMMQEALDLADTQESSGASDSTMLATSSEPKNYARLNNNTSYLRAVFDTAGRLCEESKARTLSQKDVETMANILLTSLRKTAGPLPSVNWFRLLADLSRISEDTHRLCILFASTHAAASLSLSEYLISELNHSKDMKNEDLQALLVSEVGLGRVLSLSGLTSKEDLEQSGPKRRGVDAVIKMVSISSIRVRELFESYCKKFMHLPLSVQQVFLDTLSNHLSDPASHLADDNTAEYVQSLCDMTLYNITLKLLEDMTMNLNTEDYASLVSRAIQCSIMDMAQLVPSGLQAWLTPDHVFGKVVAIMTICKLRRTQHSVRWITETSSRLFSMDSVPLVDESWSIITSTIHESCATIDDRLSWVIRLLDVFIVLGSSEDSNDAMTHGFKVGLRQVLKGLWTGSFTTNKNCDALQVALTDVTYWLLCAVRDSEDQPEQKQVCDPSIYACFQILIFLL
ncbi:uncharacterized protein BYT42DRAFT_552475 [Radiomyces spectabilis]|uniref:uncharacterized protein n=1 Tax=Radiomyces spectabilis TaxID=64574 RepID=UPI00222045FE|nr:uncharacterized protein BYT42DRAFT_552475 [Radiomyces spectabilis]KAI8393852.1 hypothetical protein BYT42DRAFT_552475 [Radiomyces spectabilis]